MFALRDPCGFRLLVIGEMEASPVFTFETCALDKIDAHYVGDVEPGEIVIFDPQGVVSFSPFPKKDTKQCIFEYVYFARPDSLVFGESVYTIPFGMGYKLGFKDRIDAVMVIPVPDSGAVVVFGYSSSIGIPIGMELHCSHYMGWTFIEPLKGLIRIGERIKFNPLRQLIKGKSFVLLYDAMGWSTTSVEIIRMVKEVGAREVHLGISSPPNTSPLFYGLDTHMIGEDSLAYLSLDGIIDIVTSDSERFCLACFTGDYPVSNPDM